MAAFSIIKCTNCEYEENCSLREIAPDLEGCIGHGKWHHRFAEEAERKEKEAIKARNRERELILNEARIKELKIGDKVQLIGTTISLGVNLPRYLDNGVFTVLGVTKTGKIKCDWDGGKPFNIPALCLKKLEK